MCIFPTKQKERLEVGSSRLPFLLVVFALLTSSPSSPSLSLSIPACLKSSVVGSFSVGHGLEAVAPRSAGFGLVQTFRAAKAV